MKMRILIIILTLLTICKPCIGQEKLETEDERLFDQAFALYEDEILDSALLLFKQLRHQYPNSKLTARVHYNIGCILKDQGKTSDAKTVFKEILVSNYKERDRGGWGIMGPQYALYKHFSCEQLAEIYILEDNFIEGEKYVKLFDKRYPYEHFCGNELTAYQIFKARSYAKVYSGQGKTDEAIKQLIPHLFYTGLAENDELIEDLIVLLDKRYNRKHIEGELRKSITSLKITVSRRKGETATIELFDFKLDVNENGLFTLSNPDFGVNTKLEGEEMYLKVIRTNELFRHYAVE